VLAYVIFSTSAVYSQQWTRFRGPNGQGISYAKTIPVKWTQADYNWKVQLPGIGYSSPVLWKDKVFITSADQKAARGILLALHASDGKMLWESQYQLTAYRMNRDNSYAAATPAVDAERLYVLWPAKDKTILSALNHNGIELWKRTFTGFHCQHGPCISPIVYNDIVVFTIEHETNGGDADSVWLAVDTKTGRTRWQLKRQTSQKTSYSTPCIYSPPDSAPQLIFTSLAHGITGVEPNSGKVLWEFKSAFTSRVVSSPVIAGGLLLGTSGDGSSGKQLTAIRPGSSDKSLPATEVYKIEDRSVPYVPTSVAADELLFTFHDMGQVSCRRSSTGQLLWQEQPAGKFYGSPVCVDGKIYCIDREGRVVVIKAAPTYELLAVNPLGEKSFSTPAVADGTMYLRTYSHLISIGGN